MEKVNLEDQFRDRKFVLALILVITSILLVAGLLFLDVPKENVAAYGIATGFIFKWADGAVKAYFRTLSKQDKTSEE